LYVNRRRIRRRSEIGDLRATREISVPSVGEPLRITPAHVDASHALARERLQATADAMWGEARSNQRFDDARERIADHLPDDAETDSERHASLLAYRDAVGTLGLIRGRYDDRTTGGEPSDDLQQAMQDLETALNGFQNEYRGASVTEVAVQSGQADQLASSAADDLERARDRLADESTPNSLVWMGVEDGRMQRHDAAWFVREQDGPSRTDALAARFEQLVELTEERKQVVTWEYSDGIASQAFPRLAHVGIHTAPEKHRKAGRVALAVREQARSAVIATTLDVLDVLPSQNDLDKLDEPVVSDAETLLDTKQTAVDQIESAIDEVGDDPLGQFLLTETVDLVGSGDSLVAELLSNVNSDSTEEWRATRDRAYLHYREASAQAREIPTLVRLVQP
jgi:hypothetical protein